MKNITVKRQEAENSVYELMDRIEGKKNGYNSSMWKAEFAAMNDQQFVEFMKNLKENISFEMDSLGKGYENDLLYIQKVADYYKIPLTEYVMFPHKNPDNPDMPVVSKTPVMKLIVPARRLQQFLSKKNAATSDTDSVNSITGQVTGESKAAALTDTQTCSLATTNLKYSIKELLGPRSDDHSAKMKMMELIDKDGEVSINDLNMRTRDKQSILTMEVFLRGAGLATNIMNLDRKK